jgi:hypothetical protein
LDKALLYSVPFCRSHFRGLGEVTAAVITALAARPVGTRCGYGLQALVDVCIDDPQRLCGSAMDGLLQSI